MRVMSNIFSPSFNKYLNRRELIKQVHKEFTPTVPEKTPRPLTPKESEVMLYVNGARTIVDIASFVGVSGSRAGCILSKLRIRGHLEKVGIYYRRLDRK